MYDTETVEIDQDTRNNPHSLPNCLCRPDDTWSVVLQYKASRLQHGVSEANEDCEITEA